MIPCVNTRIREFLLCSVRSCRAGENLSIGKINLLFYSNSNLRFYYGGAHAQENIVNLFIVLVAVSCHITEVASIPMSYHAQED